MKLLKQLKQKNNTLYFIYNTYENIIIKSLRDKEKNNKIIIKKANSGSFRNCISLKLTETEEKNKKTIKFILCFYVYKKFLIKY